MRTKPPAVVVTLILIVLAIVASLAPAQRRARPAASQPAAGSAEKHLTAAHLAALRTGGELRLPPGTYTSPAPVEIRGLSGFALLGDGVTIRAAVRIVECRDFRVSGITFDGDRAARGPEPNAPTLRVYKCTGFALERLKFKDARGEHLYIAEHNARGVVRDCHMTDAWRNAIAVIAAHDLRFENNTIETVHGEVLGAGIDIESNATDPLGSNHDITIVGNTFRDCAETGVKINNGREPYRVDVLDNVFENCPTGVHVAGRDCRVRGNVFRDAKRPDPTTRIGAWTRAQVFVSGTAAGGLTEVTGNRFERLEGIGGVRSHPTWRGTVVVANNVFSGLSGRQVNAVSVYSADAIVTGNVVLDVEDGVGIGISGRGATVTNNVLRAGGGAGAIWSDVAGGRYAGNHVTGWQAPQVLPKGNHVD